MRTEIFYVGNGYIFLKGECIVGFRTLSSNAVECHIESRPYDTVYRLKPLFWRLRNKGFIQVRRKK